MMNIFGLEPYAASILITSLGVGLMVLIGWLKSPNKFQPRNVAASAIIGFLTSMQLVAAEIAAIEVTDPNLQLPIIGGLILQVMGMDKAVKGGLKAAIGRSGGWARKNTGSQLDGIIQFLRDELNDSKDELAAARDAGQTPGIIAGIETEIKHTASQLEWWINRRKRVQSRFTWLN